MKVICCPPPLPRCARRWRERRRQAWGTKLAAIEYPLAICRVSKKLPASLGLTSVGETTYQRTHARLSNSFPPFERCVAGQDASFRRRLEVFVYEHMDAAGPILQHSDQAIWSHSPNCKTSPTAAPLRGPVRSNRCRANCVQAVPDLLVRQRCSPGCDPDRPNRSCGEDEPNFRTADTKGERTTVAPQHLGLQHLLHARQAGGGDECGYQELDFSQPAGAHVTRNRSSRQWYLPRLLLKAGIVPSRTSTTEGFTTGSSIEPDS